VLVSGALKTQWVEICSDVKVVHALVSLQRPHERKCQRKRRITTNFDQYLKVFDELMAYDFNTFVGGHLTSIGNKRDVEDTKEFTMDVYQTVNRIHNSMDQQAVVAEAAKTIGYDNKFLLFKVILDKVTAQAVAELRPRWINRLAGVDVWLETQIRSALIYVRWDDKVQ
jgi:hypothetical protein